MNSISITGYLGKDPEISNLPSGTAVATFRIAENEVYTANGNKQKHTNWFTIKAFGRLAEIAKNLSKGKKVGVIGKLRYNEWESEAGKRNTIRIIAQKIEFLSPAEPF